MSTPFQPSGIRLGIARGVSYGLFGPPDDVMAPSRELGAGLVRLYVYWGQVQPEPERWDWTTVDAFLSQLTSNQEVWVTVCSSSHWATREGTDFLPSPAKDDDTFFRFVHALVSRCAGRVQYWQCNNEPSNVGLLWSGSAGEYVNQLSVLHRAVRDADPSAAVVLGGCGYDVLSASADEPPRRFFDHVLVNGRDFFDLFAIHLYDDPPRIPGHIQTVREMMRAHGYERPVVVGEYNGPTLFQLPEAGTVLQQTMANAFANGNGGDAAHLSTGELAANVELDTPERQAMRALYARMPDLPAPLQMLMADCPPGLEERRHRINCREIVSRNLFALAAGARRTVCWHLAREVPRYEDPLTMMELLQGKLLLLGYEGDQPARRYPAAHTFRLLADQLDGAESVTRVDLDDRSDVFAFTVERRGRDPLVVLWKDGDTFTGEDEKPTLVTWPWPHSTAVTTDAFGATRHVDVQDGQLQIPVTVTPLFLTAPARADTANRLESRLGPLAWRSSGEGPPLVFFAGALANGDLWRDVVVALEDRYRCITIDLPLGGHRWPLSPGADRSASSLARLLLDCLELLDVEHATIVANDTAGGLVLLSLATGHPALSRVDRLVLTNCESYDKFPPDALKKATAACRTVPRLARALLRLQLRSSIARRKLVATVAARGLDHDRAASFFDPMGRDRRVADDFVAAFAGFRPQLMLDAAEAIPRFQRPVLLIWGESCDFFPITDAQRLASEFPEARLVSVPDAKTWVPIDNPAAAADAIINFVPTTVWA